MVWDPSGPTQSYYKITELCPAEMEVLESTRIQLPHLCCRDQTHCSTIHAPVRALPVNIEFKRQDARLRSRSTPELR